MDSPWFRKKYSNIPNSLESLIVKVKDSKYKVLINPDLGNWVYFPLKKNLSDLDYPEKEFLYNRGMMKTFYNKKLQIKKPDIQKRSPSSFIFNLTDACNLQCKYCFASSSRNNSNFMSKEVIMRAIDELSNVPHKQVRVEFQGGEPLLAKKKLFFAVEYAQDKLKEKSVKFGVETNGTLIDREYIKLFEDLDAHVGVSIDGPKEIHNRGRMFGSGKGSFDEAERGLYLLLDSKLPKQRIGCISVIGKHNCNHPKKLVDFFNEKKIPFKPVPVNPVGRAKKGDIGISSKEWYNFFVEALEYSKKKGIENTMAKVFETNTYTPLRDYICLRSPCGMANEIASINPDGSVLPCDGFKSSKDFNLGNILEESLGEIFSKNKTKSLSCRDYKDIESCSKCLFRGMCGPCAYSSLGKFGNVYEKDPFCEARKKIFLYLIKRFIKRVEK